MRDSSQEHPHKNLRTVITPLLTNNYHTIPAQTTKIVDYLQVVVQSTRNRMGFRLGHYLDICLYVPTAIQSRANPSRHIHAREHCGLGTPHRQDHKSICFAIQTPLRHKENQSQHLYTPRDAPAYQPEK